MQATDRRRFNGPEGSPLVFVTSSDPAPVDLARREDGRTAGEVRPIFLKTGLVTQASGSAYIETGRTKMICAVYGPKPTPPSAPFNAKARLNVEVKLAPFSSGTRRFAPGKDTEAPNLSAALHQSLLPSLILEALPKSQIDLFLTILESDGSDNDISAGVTAASVALAEAGVQMYGITVGCHAGFLPGQLGTPLLDPTRSEAAQCSAFATLACMPALGTITNVGMKGVVPVASFEDALAQCFAASGQIHAVSKAALVESLEATE